MKRRITTHLLLIVLVFGCMGIFSTLTPSPVHAQTMTSSAHTRAATSACSTWNWDTERVIYYKGSSLGKTLYFNWDITFYALRDCSTGQYQGRVYANVCIDIPAGVGWPSVGLWNQWYASSGQYLGENEDILYLSNYAQTFCSSTPSWSIPTGGNATVVTFLLAPNGSYIAGEQYATDYDMV